MQQQRYVLALVISAAILLGWSYLFPTPSPKQNKTNPSPAQEEQQQTATTPPAQTTASHQPPSPNESVASIPEEAPQRIVQITTPLYEVKLDSRGAIATSWIIKKNKDTGRDLFSAVSERHNQQPLQLVSQEGLNRHEAPLRLVTGDQKIDEVLSSRNYRVNGVENESGDVNINLAPGEPQRIDFTLRDESTGLDVTKSLTFSSDQYNVTLGVLVKRDDQIIPEAKLALGPSIGDQSIPLYSFYSVAPEGIAVVAGKDERHQAASINHDKKSPDRLQVNGPVDWAGVGDTYFAMIAVPPQVYEGLEYRTTQYDHQANGKKEPRYLITAFVPIPTDGSQTQLYVGPKDHYLLTSESRAISQAVGRQVDLERSIDYGFLGIISRPLAVPILWSIKNLRKLTGSYGVAIILFTIIIYSLFFPLKWRSSKSMKKAQKLAPRMKELQEKIKGMKQTDPRLKDLQMEQLRLMKEGNPLGGCLPLLIQMPFLFALYRAITISIDFRQASFLWIPDLSAAEPYAIHLLPILFAASMIVLQLITPQPSADPLQRKMMAFGMPFFMLWMMWSVPSGLLVYWLVGNIVGFGQQMLINRLTKSEDDEEPPPEKKAAASARKKLSTARVSQA
jgi:YidC/Oxa1 family membrane protein insertase